MALQLIKGLPDGEFKDEEMQRYHEALARVCVCVCLCLCLFMCVYVCVIEAVCVCVCASHIHHSVRCVSQRQPSSSL
jgi:hypothetical protein